MGNLEVLSIDLSMIFHILNFFILYLIFRFYFSKKIMKMIEDRRNFVSQNIDKSVSERVEAEKLRLSVEKKLADAREKAREVLKEAVQSADSLKRDGIHAAYLAKEKILQDGELELKKREQSLKQAMESQTLTLAVSVAEHLLKKSVDTKIQQEVFADFKGKVSSQL